MQLDKVKELQHQFMKQQSGWKEEQGKNLKLRAQINRDYENSSIPSSKTLRKKKDHEQQGKDRKETRRPARP